MGSRTKTYQCAYFLDGFVGGQKVFNTLFALGFKPVVIRSAAHLFPKKHIKIRLAYMTLPCNIGNRAFGVGRYVLFSIVYDFIFF